MRIGFVQATVGTLVVAAAAVAQPLNTAFTYQGELQAAGSPANGPHDLRFRLFDAAAGGTQVGPTLCSDNVVLAGGRFGVVLDFGPQFSGQQRFLEVEVRPDTGLGCGNSSRFIVLSPRQALTATPHAVFALSAGAATIATTATNATQLNGQSGAFYQNAGNLSAGALPSARLAGSYSAVLNLSNAGNTYSGSGAGLTALDASNIAAGTLSSNRLPVPLGLSGMASGDGIISGTNAEPTGSGVRGFSAASSGYSIGVFGESSALNSTGTGVVGKAQATGGWFEATGASGTGLYGVASNTSGGGTDGVQGRSAGQFGVGVRGLATHGNGVTYGGRFESHSTAGVGVIGHATATSGETEGVFGRSDSPEGRGVFGLADAPTGTTYGGRFESNSESGFGVFGLATAASGNAFGVQGGSHSTSGRGVYGYASATTGSTIGGLFTCRSTSGTAVHGWANAETGSTYGVVGKRSSLTGLGYAVFAEGDLGASGYKSFRIDHPADPENKYLLHYSAESPEVMNFYSGTVALDGAGEAVVELPAYFARINKDPRYLLTAIGAAMPALHVAEEINGETLALGETAMPSDPVATCWFRIAGGVPGARVCWRIEAVRNDRWMRRRSAPAEVEKEGTERGMYQHPELYGKPPTGGIGLPADHPPNMRGGLNSRVFP